MKYTSPHVTGVFEGGQGEEGGGVREVDNPVIVEIREAWRVVVGTVG